MRANTLMADRIRYYYQFGTDNSRCSLATYVLNGGIGPDDFGIIEAPSSATGKERRPLLWVRVPFPVPFPVPAPSFLYIGNVHLISGVQSTARDHLNNYFKPQMVSKIPYVIAGDFNMPLPYIKREFSTEADKFYSISPPRETQKSGGILDYVYSPNEAVNNMEFGYDFGISDHIFLKCIIS